MKRRILTALALIMAVSMTVTAGAAEKRTDITGKPSGITRAGNGKLLVTDIWEMAIWELDGVSAKKLTGNGKRDLLGKVIGGRENGTINSASFYTPFAIVPYRNGYAVSDTDNNLIRFISSDQTKVSTIAGSGYTGLANGRATEARFDHPTGLAADLEGNLYISDTNNNLIRKLDKYGNIVVFAGGSEGYAVGSLSDTQFNMPTGLFWYEGKLYVADSGNHRIVVIENGLSEVLAGGVKNRADEYELNGGSYRNGSLEMAGFSNPQGVLADEHCVYVADTGNGAVRKIADGLVSTCGDVLSPCGMVLTDGILYVCDTNTNSVIALGDDLLTPIYSDATSDSVEAYRYGIFTGIENNVFGPNSGMTRAQYIKALSNMHSFLFPDAIIAGESEAFTDVPKDSYYTDAVYWSRAVGVAAGTGKNLFSPDMEITRESAAAFLYKYAEIMGYDISSSNSSFAGFSDSAEISEWASPAMKWAISSGVFDDELSGKLNPRGKAEYGWTARIFTNFIYLKK